MSKKDSKKTLSIVVPTYNVENYIERCLNSLVLNKDVLEKLDVIVVNDGSKDNSLKIAQVFEKKYPNSIKVVDKENGGHGSTINEGLKIAKGKYFRVLDSDDWFNVDDFRIFVNELEKINSDFVITNYSKVKAYDGEQDYYEYDNLTDGTEYNLDKIDLKILDGRYFYMATTTTKTEVLRQSNFKLSEKTFYVDMEYNTFPIKNMTTFTYLDLDIYRYWIGRPEQSMDVNALFRNRNHHEKVFRRLIDYYNKNKSSLSNNKRKYIENIIYAMGCTHYLIYINSNNTNKDSAEEIRKLDNWVKKECPEISKRIDSEIHYIELYRKTNFVFMEISPKQFRRLALRKKINQEES